MLSLVELTTLKAKIILWLELRLTNLFMFHHPKFIISVSVGVGERHRFSFVLISQQTLWRAIKSMCIGESWNVWLKAYEFGK